MATTDTMFILEPSGMIPPATLGAALGLVVDTSTPVGHTPVLKFDTTTAWWAYWWVTCPSNYAGGGFTISMKSGTDNTSVGDFDLNVGMAVVADATILTGDLGFDSMSTKAALNDTPPTTPINKLNYSGAQTLTHSAAGSPSVADRMIISAVRGVAGDNNTGFLQLAEILILET